MKAIGGQLALTSPASVKTECRQREHTRMVRWRRMKTTIHTSSACHQNCSMATPPSRLKQKSEWTRVKKFFKPACAVLILINGVTVDEMGYQSWQCRSESTNTPLDCHLTWRIMKVIVRIVGFGLDGQYPHEINRDQVSEFNTRPLHLTRPDNHNESYRQNKLNCPVGRLIHRSSLLSAVLKWSYKKYCSVLRWVSRNS